MHRLLRAAAAALFVFFLPACAFQPTAAVAERHYMAVAAHPLAADAGADVLARGGSAVDAAIAVQMVLGLVEPESSGIGGGAFLLHWSEQDHALESYDGRETAPAAARRDRFMKSDGTPYGFYEAVIGGRSVGVPGVLRMLELAHRKHGRLPWRSLFSYAIRAAEEGFPMPRRLHDELEDDAYLRDEPIARALYYLPDGRVRPVGSRVVNPEYAAVLREIAARGADAFYEGVLREIAARGADAFYEGDIARAIVQAVRANAKPGDLTESDLAGYRARERPPVCGPHLQWRICSMGPPSSGGIAVLQILGLLERKHFERVPAGSAEAVHLFAEAGRLAYADRARYLGDPDFVTVPTEKLLDAHYLDRRAGLIGERSMRLAVPGDTEAVGTTHFSIVDREGNAVAMTSTIESAFGSHIMVRGFLLNNELTDFDFVPGGANEVRPGKRPRSSMAPTLVFAPGGSLEVAIGSPGGPNIINYVAKALVAMLDWRLDVQSAVAVPNFGSRNGPTLIERNSSYAALVDALRARGHEVELRTLRSGLHGLERVPGGWRGGADPRREGAARGG